ncbi:MAG: Pseudouridine synthase, Rsu [Candidatus Peregrinibacteria bacterium GW2011_GWF2_33_10]|nr:MAG: Pseudouridine synthase, Rsu [Candidatus Peregrinibacteria bacterium GW2011_GWF2_33_10]OGJ44630.1 MAG: hypothetical protein A2263_00085 [Candidatus Peregrinibacteria bacterium RIFOXYA2_FULL_33_21]OGJ46424.1 MAG: hypothetical protein A2272_06660 [Candidatus Peregrinibacteria bacterium RIFOXYA12_FULL_33_12]OGJ50265.1 MAG: hypothetical protein A2307_01730 [Candidatus Peregrinibacteria bacterium RIFOXYB2_FULL_33_20]
MRLQKFIGNLGYVSRRKAEELIRNEQVKVNGETITELWHQVDPASHPQIEIKNQEIKSDLNKTYIILNKPKGYTCTKKEFINEKNIYELLPPQFANLHYTGRLDKDSSGLMILTNDGDFTQQMTHPKFALNKIYLAKIKGELTTEKISKFCNGLKLEDGLTAKAKLEVLKQKEDLAELKITIHEGKKRQIRRMFEFLNLRVLNLHRLQIGPIKLPKSLPERQWRILDIKEFPIFNKL